ncbi:hypothetical protein CLOSTMETH_00720 [[Clostridium] methylpentosum DSM 5476]|uniref:Uncharacterized protein n=1 Tax=[Clostridium] methylpentosum DSM 5476 TaxID=537013 RepID=C0EA66_9FIRM|nr:hypothetical protein CLOSTMETH_00720 [[Clostridium] methylpentosum DSM 5476]
MYKKRMKRSKFVLFLNYNHIFVFYIQNKPPRFCHFSFGKRREKIAQNSISSC